MGTEPRRAGALVRLVLLLLAALVLAGPSEAQKGKGRGKGKKAPAAWGSGLGAAPKSFGGGTGGLPGFDEPGGKKKKGARGQGPKGPSQKVAPKKQAQQQQPSPPPDPLKEADQVTAVADHRAEVDEAEEKLLREHFKVCDLDGNGWLSLRELELTLALGRDEFRRADANQDGRLAPPEFALKKELFLARLGARVPEKPRGKDAGAEREPVSAPPHAAPAADADQEPDPTAKPNLTEPNPSEARPRRRPRAALAGLDAIFPRPADLLGRYDVDHSKGLDVPETEKLLLELGLELSAEQIVSSMDPNDSGQLEGAELRPLALLASEHVPESLRPPPEPAAVADDSPGPAEPPGADSEPAQGPAAAVRAATHFGRLDADHDGWIGENDLRALQSPARVDLRLTAVLSVLDKDGDGKLSEDEFRAAMRAAPR